MFTPPQFGPTVAVTQQPECAGCFLCLACAGTPTPDFEFLVTHLAALIG